MSDWIYDNFGWIAGAAVALFIVLVIAAGQQRAEQKAAFMASCMADHKDYECLALWGQANAGNGNDMATGIAVGTAIGIGAGRR